MGAGSSPGDFGLCLALEARGEPRASPRERRDIGMSKTWECETSVVARSVMLRLRLILEAVALGQDLEKLPVKALSPSSALSTGLSVLQSRAPVPNPSRGGEGAWRDTSDVAP